ncbi:phage holin [Lactococcus garvieae]|uniref:phage holin n=1 Tax=Lactococcus garvieae TaxID=1363 RepID=UPI0030CC80AC
MILNNNVYSAIKWIVLIVLPALSTLVGVLGKAYGWEGTDLAVITLTAFTTFLGTITGLSAVSYNNQKEEE